MLLLQQQQQAQQIYQSQAEQVFSHAYSMPAHDHHRAGNTDSGAFSYNHNNIIKPTSFPGESELLSLLQLPRTSSLPSFTATNRGKGPLYSSSTIAGPVNTGEFFESRLGLSHGTLHHPNLSATLTAASSFFHSFPRADLTGNNASSNSFLSRQAPILLDFDQDRDDADGKASTSPFALKRGDNSIGALGKGGESRGVNHFATERQRREFLNEKYQTLRSLVPNPTKVSMSTNFLPLFDHVWAGKIWVETSCIMYYNKLQVLGRKLFTLERRDNSQARHPSMRIFIKLFDPRP